jgi:hypothetical protein
MRNAAKPQRLISAVLGAGLPWAAALLAQTHTGPQPQPSHVEASAQLDRETTAPGERITFKLHLKNISNEPISVMKSRPPENVIELSAVDDKNHPVPFTPSGEALIHGIKIGGGGPVLLKPGEETVFDLDASKLFAFTKPGIYQVTARYGGPITTSEGNLPQKQVLASERVAAKVEVRVGE